MSKVNVSKLFGGVFLRRQLHRKYGFYFKCNPNQTNLLLRLLFNFLAFSIGLPSVSFFIFTPIYNYIKHQKHCNFHFQFVGRVWCSNFLFSLGRQPFDRTLIKQQDRFGKRIVLFYIVFKIIYRYLTIIFLCLDYYS